MMNKLQSELVEYQARKITGVPEIDRILMIYVSVSSGT